MFESMGSAHMYDPHVMFQPAYLILPVIPQSSECFSNLTYCIWEKLIIMINILYMYVFLFEDIGKYRRTYVGVRKNAGFKFVEHCYHTCIYIYIYIYWLLNFINTTLFFKNLRHIKLRFVLFTFSVQGGDGISLMISSSHWLHHSLSMPFTSKFFNASVSQFCSAAQHHRASHEKWIKASRTNHCRLHTKVGGAAIVRL